MNIMNKAKIYTGKRWRKGGWYYLDFVYDSDYPESDYCIIMEEDEGQDEAEVKITVDEFGTPHEDCFYGNTVKVKVENILYLGHPEWIARRTKELRSEYNQSNKTRTYSAMDNMKIFIAETCRKYDLDLSDYTSVEQGNTDDMDIFTINIPGYKTIQKRNYGSYRVFNRWLNGEVVMGETTDFKEALFMAKK